MGAKTRPKCPNCGIEMKGCGCLFTTASDKSKVHKTCLEQYEDKIKEKKLTCAHCDEEFTENPYFKGDDGKYLHFKCVTQYGN